MCFKIVQKLPPPKKFNSKNEGESFKIKQKIFRIFFEKNVLEFQKITRN